MRFYESQDKERILPYKTLSGFFSLSVVASVHCAVQTGSLNKADNFSSSKAL
jgi:hypothetical protein